MILIRIIRNLFFKSLALFLGPLHFLWGPLLRIGIPIALLWLAYTALFGGADTSSGHENNSRYAQTADPKAYTSRDIEPVAVREDGNSVYSTDMWDKMAGDERAYYSHMFNWAMEHVEDGVTLPWDKFNIGGKFTPHSPFTNGTGKTCRRFEEVLKVHEVEQTISGIGCMADNGGWCKLRSDDAPSCNIGYMSDWDRTTQQWGVGWKRFLDGVF